MFVGKLHLRNHVHEKLVTPNYGGEDNLSGGAGKNGAGYFKKHSKKAPYTKS